MPQLKPGPLQSLLRTVQGEGSRRRLTFDASQLGSTAPPPMHAHTIARLSYRQCFRSCGSLGWAMVGEGLAVHETPFDHRQYGCAPHAEVIGRPLRRAEGPYHRPEPTTAWLGPVTSRRIDSLHQPSRAYSKSSVPMGLPGSTLKGSHTYEPSTALRQFARWVTHRAISRCLGPLPSRPTIVFQ